MTGSDGRPGVRSDGGNPDREAHDRHDADHDAEQEETDHDADHDIRALDDATVQRIAAGEVVERPASVVKELVENSLDAGASRISVAVDGDGTDRIQVRDDGAGMTESALRVAVEEHTTSKIADVDDLEAGIASLGFRGEALHTIGAVSRLRIRSKPRGGDRGTELRYEGGDRKEVRPAGCPEGTVVEVEELFYNTPARRKFLKTAATEFDHVNRVVTHYALANPDVAVSLDHDGREVFATEGRGNLASTVLSVYGREVAESMVPVDAEVGDGDDATDAVSVSGLVSHPETTRSSREYLSTFVNGRYVTAATLREAVLDAYGGQLANDRYPFAVLFVDLDPDAVDVNVHPRKMEVRFDDERRVREAVESAVESALVEGGLVRSGAPRGRSAPAETEVRPESPETEATLDADSRTEPTTSEGTGGQPADSSPSGDSQSTADRPTATGDRRPSTTARSGGSDAAESASRTRSTSTDHSAADDRPWSRRSASETSASEGSPSRSATPDTETPPSSAGPAEPTEQTALDGDATDDGDGRTDAPSGLTGLATQRTLDGDAVDRETSFERLPRMRVLGQIHGTYIVAETEGGLVLVDQHAADERVNYERLSRELAGETPTQALASPVELELTAREAALFEAHREALARVGFHAGRVGERRVEVRTVPAVFDATLDPDLLRDALADFVDADRDAADTVDAVADDLLADLACYPSITGNTSLTEGSVLDLLEALDACENPYACPHGRPVLIRFDAEEIDERFERDYPGHGGRRREE